MESPRLKLKTHLKFKSVKLATVVFFIFGFVIGFGVGYFLQHIDREPQMEKALVTRVIDGDTIELANGYRVRYLGIDTPEAGEPFSKEATAKNKQLVEGKIIELQKGKRDQDEYERLLRYVYVDGLFVNAELVTQGYATAYIFDPDERYSQVLVQLEQYAKLRNIRLWKQ